MTTSDFYEVCEYKLAPFMGFDCSTFKLISMLVVFLISRSRTELFHYLGKMFRVMKDNK